MLQVKSPLFKSVSSDPNFPVIEWSPSQISEAALTRPDNYAYSFFEAVYTITTSSQSQSLIVMHREKWNLQFAVAVITQRFIEDVGSLLIEYNSTTQREGLYLASAQVIDDVLESEWLAGWCPTEEDVRATDWQLSPFDPTF